MRLLTAQPYANSISRELSNFISLNHPMCPEAEKLFYSPA